MIQPGQFNDSTSPSRHKPRKVWSSLCLFGWLKSPLAATDADRQKGKKKMRFPHPRLWDLSWNGRAASAVAAASLHSPPRSPRHQMSPAPFTRCPRKPLERGPEGAASFGGGSPQPLWGPPASPPHPLQHQRGPNCTSASSQLPWKPLSAASLGAGPWDQCNRTSPPGPEPLRGLESFVLKVFIHPDFLGQKLVK